MNEHDERADGFEADAAGRYRRAADSLAPEIGGALRRARAEALGRRPRRTARWPHLAAATGAAAIVVALLLVQAPDTAGPPPVTAAEDLDLLLDGEDLDLLAELDFYAWLETQADVG